MGSAGLKITDVVVLHCSGSIDHETQGALEATIQRLVGNGHFHLILDVKEVTYISSAGVNALLSAMNEAGGVKIVLVGANTSVFTVLSLIGVTELIPVAENFEEAVKLFEAHAANRISPGANLNE